MTAYQKKLEGIDGKVRVRMAPSPTGNLHIGTARTTLFNWLFARNKGGTFILRIEDTDKERSKKEYEAGILEGLRWLGLDWDEGPDIGGNFGPYRQSERIEIYQKYLEQLLNDNKAYFCFCSKENLEAQKQDAEGRGVLWKYPGTCANLSPEEIKEKIASKASSVIRMRMPNKKITFKDLIKGESTFDCSLFGDLVIAKKTNEPLYNFAVVIDDYEMKITQVIRGEDHYSNTPKQIALYELFGWTPPEFAHLPLILGQDRSKLSKRHGATTSITEYRDNGFLPEALINFIVLLGWHPSGDREIFSLNDLQQEFSIDRVQKVGAVFNEAKLDWLNNHYLKEKPLTQTIEFLLPFFEKKNLLKRKGKDIEDADKNQISQNYLGKAIQAALEKSKSLEEIIEMADIFFKEPVVNQEILPWKEMTTLETKESLQRIVTALKELSEESFRQEEIEKYLSKIYPEKEKGKILWPMRAALSGKKVSVGPLVIAEIFGKEKTLRILKKAADALI